MRIKLSNASVIAISVSFALAAGFATPALAADAPAAAPAASPGTTRLVNPLPTTSIPVLLGNVINAFLGIIGSVTLLVFVYGGILWLTSGGSAEAIAKGKNAMVWAAIGLIVVFSSYALVRLVLQGIGAASKPKSDTAGQTQDVTEGSGAEGGSTGSDGGQGGTKKPGTCSTDADCRESQRCAQGKCVDANVGVCVFDTNCPSDQRCEEGFCVPGARK